jgi:hypothetical protein
MKHAGRRRAKKAEIRLMALTGLFPWIDADAPVNAALEIWGRQVPPGWRPLLGATLVKLTAVSGSVKRDVALAALKVVSSNSRLHFRIEVEDAVIHGIVRKASERSAVTCRQCGRAGRLRDLGDGHQAVLCHPLCLHRTCCGTMSSNCWTVRHFSQDWGSTSANRKFRNC